MLMQGLTKMPEKYPSLARLIRFPDPNSFLDTLPTLADYFWVHFASAGRI
jgi:hypothetical protein